MRVALPFVFMIVPLAVAGITAVAARQARLLTTSGAIAAIAVGAASLATGYSWAILLLFFFITSSVLSRWRAVERHRLLESLVEKDGPRDAAQVLANGGVFALAAILSARDDALMWQAVAAGAIATATADTWSTEIGTVFGRAPRTIPFWRPVPPGTSGGITIHGTAAALAGALAGAVVAALAGWPIPFHAIVVGGFGGSLFDSVLGSLIQERRWCPACDVATERRTHTCGTTTVHRGGIRGFDNDVVNLISTIAGAMVTCALT